VLLRDYYYYYYDREPYKNDRTIDSVLTRAEDAFAAALEANKASLIRADYTAPPASFKKRMVQVVGSHARHPTTITHREPGGDATTTCTPSVTQHVTIAWGWFDTRWRAFPTFAPNGKPHPGW
jgi:hypothetical protein